jgi:ankyrin repeat protein
MSSLPYKPFFSIIIVAAVLSWIPLQVWLMRDDRSLLGAVIAGDTASVKREVSGGTSVHMTIRRHFTLLQAAALHTDNTELAKYLVEQGVSADAVNDDGDTALTIAVREKHLKIASYLESITTNRKSAGQNTDN